MPATVILALIATLGVGGVLLALLIIAFLNPDKAERWGEIVWALIARVYRGGNRKAVQLGVQSRLNSFAIELAGETGRGEATQVKVEWAPANELPNHFFADNRLVVRLHAHEHQDRNILNASLFYVSQTLVRRAKRYLSKRQARSIDLYAVDRLLTRTAPRSADLLHEEIIGPECDDDRDLGSLIVDYKRMDRSSTFFPIFVRELNYLAHKVVVKPKGGELVSDVKELHGFLVRYAERIVGDEIPLEVRGRFLRCAVMIIARSFKRDLGDRGPYVRKLSHLANAGYETLYLVGYAAEDNRAFMTGIAEDFKAASGWSELDRRESYATLHHKDATNERARVLLIVLRTNEERELVGKADEIPISDDLPTLEDIDSLSS